MRTRARWFVGRDSERGLLMEGLGKARSARGTSFFVVGDPGIGKSRLAAEAALDADTAGMVVLRGRCSALGPTVPFRPLAEALLSLSRNGISVVLDGLGPFRPVLGRLIPGIDDSEPTPVDTSLLVLAEAVLRLFSVVGRDRGLLLVLEDLHDADAETLALIEYLVDNLDDAATMILATCRNGLSSGLTLAHAMAQRQVAQVVELEGLNADELRELAASCLDTAHDAVPDSVLRTLLDTAAGNPLMVEHLLHEMVSNGQLTRSEHRWRVIGDVRPAISATFTRSIAERADRLGFDGRRVLSAAAVLGHRFPISVLQQVTQLDDHDLFRYLRAGVAAQLILGDAPPPDWYAFQHPTIGEALLSLLSSAERAELSGRAADAIERIYPGVPGEWCQLVASLWTDAGEPASAALWFAEAGRRALAEGAAKSAIMLLERAWVLSADQSDRTTHTNALQLMLDAYAEVGRFDRAFQLASLLDDQNNASLTSAQRAGFHLRLARVCDLAGRWSDGMEQLENAQLLLGPDPADEHACVLDSVAAELALSAPESERMVDAEHLARRAMSAAERSGQPAIRCQAWLTIAVIARRRDMAESDACLREALVLADKHRLPVLRTNAQYLLGVHRWLANGSTTGLDLARQVAQTTGAVMTTCEVDASIALNSVLCGDFDGAAAMIAEQLLITRRLQMAKTSRYLMVASATLAAHQGRHQDMERALFEFRDAGGAESKEEVLALGFAEAFAALLAEDADAAGAILGRLVDQEQSRPTSFSLAGRHGLHPLMQVLRGDLDRAAFDEVCSAPASTMRWNRQFVLLGDAVLLGREGRPDEAAARFSAAREAAAIYPMARNIALRLVAESAHHDGWGDPWSWLTQAEDYFRSVNNRAVADSCRALQRRMGGPVRQWRTGTLRVPAELRLLGVTTREFEVLELLSANLTNRSIASRLHISPRTVEKHVASLMSKLSQPNRHALAHLSSQQP